MLDTRLIVWDEAPMMHRFAINAVDRMFRSVKQVDEPFGGVTVVFMGDWRQTLPVVPLASKEQKIASTLLFADCWKYVKVIRLTENLRIRKHGGDAKWSDYLLRVGEDKLSKSSVNGIEYTRIPNSMVIESGRIKDLLSAVYPN